MMIAGPGLQLLWCTVRHYFAVGDDHCPIAYSGNLFEYMCRDDYYLVFGQTSDHLSHLMLLVRVEPVSRFIQYQHLWIVENGLGKPNPSLETLGQCFDTLVNHRVQR